jgi:hypothetical protein
VSTIATTVISNPKHPIHPTNPGSDHKKTPASAGVFNMLYLDKQK